jgi:LPXTG-motif cell wall-anchored protein
MHQGRSGLRYMAVGLGSMAAGALLLMGAIPGNAGAAPEQESTTSSSVVTGNPDCGDLGDFEFEFRIEDFDELPEETTYIDPVTGIEITIFDVRVEGGTAFFSFTSTIPVSAVFVKAGTGGILYTFDPPTTTGIDLASPKDSISHISFCWNPPPATTTSTSTTSTSTTSTSTTSTSTTSTSTTSSTVPDTTSSTVGGSTTTAAGVSPTTVPGQLPRTGSTTGPMVGIGAALLAGGAGLVGFARRFRHS